MSASLAGGPTQPPSLVELLARAGIDRSSVIRVTGPSALSALLWLCRHDYDQVGYLRSGGGAPHEDQPDAIMVAHTCNELDLKRLLSVARRVRPGGAFIFQLRCAAEDSAPGVEWLLERAGFVIERRFAGQRRALVIARRKALPLRQAA